MELDLKNAKVHLEDLNETVRLLEIEKNHQSRKHKVVNQNKRRLIIDDKRQELDELRNERPEGTCQGVSDRNYRCTKQGVVEDKESGKWLCDGHMKQLLCQRAGYGNRLW